MKLYTRKGDDGHTSLFDGTRVQKNHPRVDAYGTLDELNALIGWCRVAAAEQPLDAQLETVQNEMFVLGSELATPSESRAASKIPLIETEAITRLEGWIDEAMAAVEPLTRFVLPGGSELAARLHVARTCCRRAERAVVTLSESLELRHEIVIYLNRLSDLLFAWARLANRLADRQDVIWKPAK